MSLECLCPFAVRVWYCIQVGGAFFESREPVFPGVLRQLCPVACCHPPPPPFPFPQALPQLIRLDDIVRQFVELEAGRPHDPEPDTCGEARECVEATQALWGTLVETVTKRAGQQALSPAEAAEFEMAVHTAEHKLRLALTAASRKVRSYDCLSVCLYVCAYVCGCMCVWLCGCVLVCVCDCSCSALANEVPVFVDAVCLVVPAIVFQIMLLTVCFTVCVCLPRTQSAQEAGERRGRRERLHELEKRIEFLKTFERGLEVRERGMLLRQLGAAADEHAERLSGAAATSGDVSAAALEALEADVLKGERVQYCIQLVRPWVYVCVNAAVCV